MKVLQYIKPSDLRFSKIIHSRFTKFEIILYRLLFIAGFLPLYWPISNIYSGFVLLSYTNVTCCLVSIVLLICCSYYHYRCVLKVIRWYEKDSSIRKWGYQHIRSIRRTVVWNWLCENHLNNQESIRDKIDQLARYYPIVSYKYKSFSVILTLLGILVTSFLAALMVEEYNMVKQAFMSFTGSFLLLGLCLWYVEFNVFKLWIHDSQQHIRREHYKALEDCLEWCTRNESALTWRQKIKQFINTVSQKCFTIEL